MIHLGAEILPDAAVRVAGVVYADAEAARAAIRAQIERAGRGHVAWWVRSERDAETLVRILFTDAGRPIGPGGVWPEIRLGDGGVRYAGWLRKWHLRTVEAWTGPGITIEDLAADGAGGESPGEIIGAWVSGRLAPAIAELGGGRVGLPGTPGTAAVQLWARRYHPRRVWTWREWTDTPELDWLRQGYRPPRCDWGAGGRWAGCQLVAPGYSAPERPDLRRVTLPPGWRLWYLDQRSAFPALMRRPMADVHGVVLRRPDLDGDGICEATVELRGGGVRCLPVRTRIDGRMAVSWPSLGTFRGVWHTLSLWKAAQGGARIEIHRHRIWRDTYTPWAAFVDAVQAMVWRTPGGPLRRALKAVGRAAYGKLGQARESRALVHRDILAAALREQAAGGEPMIGPDRLVTIYGWWGDLAAIVVEAPEYSPAVNPVWAAGITATSAIKLGNAEAAIERAGGWPIYMDTDGIWAAGPGPMLPLGEGVGEWRVEHAATWAAFYELKRYESGGGVDGAPALTCWAGCPREAQAAAFRDGGITLERVPTIGDMLSRGARPGAPIRTDLRARRR